MRNHKLTNWIFLMTALMLLLLAGCGSTGSKDSDDDDDDAKAEKYHKEERYYDEDGELWYSEQFKNGRIRSATYYEDGEETGFEEFRKTSECKKVDTTEVRNTEGVAEVEALELFYRDADQEEMESEDYVIVFGFNERGNVVVMQCFWKIDDEYVLVFTNEYEHDSHGNTKHMTRTAADGTVSAEWDYDTEYSDGRRVRAEQTKVNYGRIQFDGESFFVELYDEPAESKDEIEYIY